MGFREMSPEEEQQVKACLLAVQHHPKQCTIVYWNMPKGLAIREAQRINLGLHDLIDSATHWAGYSHGVESGKYDVIVGLREHMPEMWQKFVTGA